MTKVVDSGTEPSSGVYHSLTYFFRSEYNVHLRPTHLPTPQNPSTVPITVVSKN